MRKKAKLIEAAYIRTKEILVKHKAELTQLALKLLLEKKKLFQRRCGTHFWKTTC